MSGYIASKEELEDGLCKHKSVSNGEINAGDKNHGKLSFSHKLQGPPPLHQ